MKKSKLASVTLGTISRDKKKARVLLSRSVVLL